MVVKTVPQLVGQRTYLLEAAVEIRQDATLFRAHDGHAVRAAALAVARLAIDPPLVEGGRRVLAQLGTESAELLDQKVAGPLPRIVRVTRPQRCEDVPPRQPRLAQLAGLALQVAAEHRERFADSAQQGVERGTVDMIVVQSGVQHAVAAAAAR
jgi:hypothetical protein